MSLAFAALIARLVLLCGVTVLRGCPESASRANRG